MDINDILEKRARNKGEPNFNEKLRRLSDRLKKQPTFKEIKFSIENI